MLLSTRCLLLLVTLVLVVGFGSAGITEEWYCDYSQDEIPTQKEVLAEELENYKNNESTRFYPAMSVFQEMTSRMACSNKEHYTRNTWELVAYEKQLGETVQRWPSSQIPYLIDDRYPRHVEKRIRDDMRAFNDDTCIEFVPRSDQGVYIRFVHPANTDLIKILPVYVGDEPAVVEKAEGDVSKAEQEIEGMEAGYTGRVKNFLRSEADIISRSSGVMATLMLVLGFHREENRHDRDDFIVLDFHPEDPKLRRLFQKEMSTPQTYLYPYDTQSAAHMTMQDAKDLGVSLTSKDPEEHPIKPYVDSILSEEDVKKINNMYCLGSWEILTTTAVNRNAPASAITQTPANKNDEEDYGADDDSEGIKRSGDGPGLNSDLEYFDRYDNETGEYQRVVILQPTIFQNDTGKTQLNGEVDQQQNGNVDLSDGNLYHQIGDVNQGNEELDQQNDGSPNLKETISGDPSIQNVNEMNVPESSQKNSPDEDLNGTDKSKIMEAETDPGTKVESFDTIGDTGLPDLSSSSILRPGELLLTLLLLTVNLWWLRRVIV
uniref:Zinc metalloproteinase nas-14-like n=1 Tax=Hirondellea gigas TaxID=1518452 RepID=A0A6A7FU94_9CRUS